jgi:enamine deaminase RidA (YjgF/YER057c/UK114 family)
MTPLLIDLDKDPDLQLRIDSYSVPAEARAEFEAGMQRSLAFLETLPGFRGHLACEKAGGASTFNIVTIAVWQNREAIANAVNEVQAYYARIGYDPRERAARLGITADIGNHYVPIATTRASARTQPDPMPQQEGRSTLVSYYNPAELPASPAYSHAAVVEGGRLVIVSGQQALDAQGLLVGPGDFKRQAERVFENVRSALAAAGASVSDVIAIDTHFVDRANLPAYREARRAFFEGRSGAAPASTTVEVPGLVAEGALIEVGVTAIVPRR